MANVYEKRVSDILEVEQVRSCAKATLVIAGLLAAGTIAFPILNHYYGLCSYEMMVSIAGSGAALTVVTLFFACSCYSSTIREETEERKPRPLRESFYAELRSKNLADFDIWCAWFCQKASEDLFLNHTIHGSLMFEGKTLARRFQEALLPKLQTVSDASECILSTSQFNFLWNAFYAGFLDAEALRAIWDKNDSKDLMRSLWSDIKSSNKLDRKTCLEFFNSLTQAEYASLNVKDTELRPFRISAHSIQHRGGSR